MADPRWKGSLSICLVISLFSAGALAQTSPVRPAAVPTKPVNLDFEDGEPGKVPTGWLATTVSSGYLAEVTTEQPRSGKQCALLRDEKATGQFGILMQVADATPYRGHRIRLRAALRAEGGRAQLWLRVDRPAKRMGFFDNMMDRPVTSASWATVEITGDIDADAESLNFGLLMPGSGRTYIDAISLEDLGKLVVVAEPARPLAEGARSNLEAFSRLLGYVRHFHPSDESAATDWNTFAVEGVRQIEPAMSPSDLASRLEAVFRPIAPTVRVVVTGQKPAQPRELEPPAGVADTVVVQWRHRGFGGASKPESAYASERVRQPLSKAGSPDGFHDPRKPFVANLPGGVTCAVPLALFADAKGTLPHTAPLSQDGRKLFKYSGDDRATRLADVALAWNIFQHFYPYFDVAKTDWQAELGRALKSAAIDANEDAFTITLRRMVAVLHDGHGGVQGPSSGQWRAALPVLWGWIENQLVVIATGPAGAEALKPGVIIEKIDGKPSREALEELEVLISSATPQWARYRALQELRMGPDESAVTFDIRSVEGERKRVSVKRIAGAAALEEARPEKIAEVQPGIFYVDIDRISDADFKAALPKLEQARGLVFDLRGYPRSSPELLRHLTDTPIQSARWNIPVISDPDWTGTPGWNTDGRWNLQPAAPRLKAKIAFVTDGQAISYAESWMGIVEAYKLGDIVGEATAGTNGNINPFTLPGGYSISWTGMKVLKHDGSRHHGVGILPNVPVSRTIRGVSEGRDEQLDRAIAIVKGG